MPHVDGSRHRAFLPDRQVAQRLPLRVLPADRERKPFGPSAGCFVGALTNLGQSIVTALYEPVVSVF